MTVLSQSEIEAFIADGYVAIRGAMPAGAAQACQDVIWSELGDGLEWSRAAAGSVRASADRRTALATGSAGDVFLCHPFLVHAASWPHRGRFPRMMAQPPVLLLSEFPLYALPTGPATAVEQAILDGLALAADPG